MCSGIHRSRAPHGRVYVPILVFSDRTSSGLCALGREPSFCYRNNLRRPVAGNRHRCAILDQQSEKQLHPALRCDNGFFGTWRGGRGRDAFAKTPACRIVRASPFGPGTRRGERPEPLKEASPPIRVTIPDARKRPTA